MRQDAGVARYCFATGQQYWGCYYKCIIERAKDCGEIMTAIHRSKTLESFALRTLLCACELGRTLHVVEFKESCRHGFTALAVIKYLWVNHSWTLQSNEGMSIPDERIITLSSYVPSPW